jgi:hypothetical protein
MWNYFFKIAYTKIKKRKKSEKISERKVLINVSPHPAREWPEEQKKGWDVIEDIKIPVQQHKFDTDELADTIYRKIKEKILSYPDADIAIFIHTDYPTAYKIYYRLKREGHKLVHPIYIKGPERLKRTISGRGAASRFSRWVEI